MQCWELGKGGIARISLVVPAGRRLWREGIVVVVDALSSRPVRDPRTTERAMGDYLRRRIPHTLIHDSDGDGDAPSWREGRRMLWREGRRSPSPTRRRALDHPTSIHAACDAASLHEKPTSETFRAANAGASFAAAPSSAVAAAAVRGRHARGARRSVVGGWWAVGRARSDDCAPSRDETNKQTNKQANETVVDRSFFVSFATTTHAPQWCRRA